MMRSSCAENGGAFGPIRRPSNVQHNSFQESCREKCNGFSTEQSGGCVTRFPHQGSAGIGGGLLHLEKSTATIRGSASTIISFLASNASTNGGALTCVGSSLSMEHVHLEGNKARRGGAISGTLCDLSLRHVSVMFNHASETEEENFSALSKV